MSIIRDKIEEFKSDLITEELSFEEIFQKHIIDGNSYFFNTYLKDNIKEYKTKTLLAEHLGVHINEVIFVGSAKLGFSLSPGNLFKEFDHKFNNSNQNRDKSDLDIAIVSDELFQRISRGVFDFTDSFQTKWYSNEYNRDGKSSDKIPIYYKYCEYFSKGWFRPDMRPKGYDFCIKNSFEDLKKELFKNYKRKTGLAIYKDWYYFKNYHITNLRKLHFQFKTNVHI